MGRRIGPQEYLHIVNLNVNIFAEIDVLQVAKGQ